MMSIGDAAAKLGVPCFPCGADKRPVIANGFKGAATDPAHIKAAFDRKGAEMIGVPTGIVSGWVVIDVDIKNGAQGRIWLDENADALPPTRTHKTRSGGLHLIFQNPSHAEVRNSASRVAPGIDVRGEGGYVIVPPSDGYTVADATEPAEMPLWLIRACMKSEAAATAPPARDDARLDKYVSSALDGEVTTVMRAPEGQRNHTLNVAAVKLGSLVGAGKLSRSTVESDLFRAAVAAGLDPVEIRATIKSGLEFGMSRPRDMPESRVNGHAPEPPPHEEYEHPGEPQQEDRTEKTTDLPLLWFSEIEPVLDVKDFVQGVLIEQGAAVVYGESNAGKTFWTTDLALHVAAGDQWAGKRVEQGGVVYCALEGGIGFRNRVAAWKKARGLENHPIPFVAIPATLNLLDPLADTPKLVKTIKAAADVMGITVKLIVVDTLSRALAGGNENAPDDMGALVMNMDTIRAETKAAVMFVHHSGKDQAKGARGHSSLRAAIDTEIEVVATDGSEAKVATVVKQREMKKGDTFGFSLEVIELGQNRHGEAVTTCLVKHGDIQMSPMETGRRIPDGRPKTAYRILCDLMAETGEAGHRGAPEGVMTVPEDWWRERFYDRALPGADRKTREKAYRRAADTLIECHAIACSAGRVWLA